MAIKKNRSMKVVGQSGYKYGLIKTSWEEFQERRQSRLF